MSAGSSFPSCSTLAAAKFWGEQPPKASRDKAKKKAVKTPRYPLAPRRAQAMLSPREVTQTLPSLTAKQDELLLRPSLMAVSYTHLTLPTIYSV